MERRRRATVLPGAERHATDLAGRLGATLRDARKRLRLTQRQAALRAGIDQTTWSRLETNRDSGYTLLTWDRAAHAVGTTLNAYLPQASAADLPRDAVHLRNQELVLRVANGGGWRGVPEQALDADLARSRHGDVVLTRLRAAAPAQEFCLIEVVDWVADAGQSVRDFQRRLAALDRHAVARMRVGDEVPRASGCWLLRATRRNRELVNQHRHFFRGRFPGSGRAWLEAITSTAAPMPSDPALLWVDVGGTRILASRLGGA